MKHSRKFQALWYELWYLILNVIRNVFDKIEAGPQRGGRGELPQSLMVQGSHNTQFFKVWGLIK